ncbi:NlpC/P60 family protein [Slackia heliotrinireducens]|uniref:NlpC/P60 family protein n=1 Tax=Slackia heliotrinireducens TaxID=84110 RepID=UPI00331633F8
MHSVKCEARFLSIVMMVAAVVLLVFLSGGVAFADDAVATDATDAETVGQEQPADEPGDGVDAGADLPAAEGDSTVESEGANDEEPSIVPDTVEPDVADAQTLADGEDPDAGETPEEPAIADGWQEVDGVKYYGKDGAYVHEWQKIEGTWYYFEPDSGAMATGWQKIKDVWYYLGTDGKMVTGWQKIKDVWYYFAGSGRMTTGWQNVNGTWYYMKDSGAMQTGWLKLEDGTYYMKPGGSMSKGWQKIDDAWYYFANSGRMRTGWLTLDGEKYYLKDNGAAAVGPTTVDGKTYLMRANCKMVQKSGWASYNGKYYYLASDFTLVKGWKQIDGKWYYLKSGGDMATGWLKGTNCWYYMRESGSMATGWQKVSGKWYYFNSNGKMKTGWLKEDGYYYRLGTNGAMLTGWYKVDSTWYYSYKGGKMATDTWIGDYYVMPNGAYSSYSTTYKAGYQNPSQYYQVSSKNVYVDGHGTKFDYVTPSRITRKATRSECVDVFIARAYQYLGTPYMWNYSLQPGVGVDCIGLVYQCAYACGMDLGEFNPYNHYATGPNGWHSHDANNFWNYGSVKHVALADRQRGDILSWNGHVGIYIGNDQMIEATTVSGNVRIASIWAHGVPRGCMRLFV